MEAGTRFTALTDTDAHGFFKLAEPVFARLAERDFVANAERLKALLEAPVAARAGAAARPA